MKNIFLENNEYNSSVVILPARMNGSHWWSRNVRMFLHGDCFLGVILANVIVHVFDGKRLMFLIVPRKPQARGLIVLVIGNIQIVGARWQDGILGSFII